MRYENKITVFYDHICQAVGQTGREAVEIAAEVKAAGISALEIRAEAFYKQPRKLDKLLKKTGLEVSCIFDFYDWGNEPDQKRAKRQVDLAAGYGADKILVVPGFLQEKDARGLAEVSDRYEAAAGYMESNREIANMARELSRLVEYADARRIRVTMEDFDGATAPYARINQLRWFLEKVPGLCYTFDTGNFAYSDEDAEEGLALLRDRIVHVHCKDRGEEPGIQRGKVNRGLKPVAVGEGYLPVGEMVKSLAESGYGGCFAIEHFDAPDQLGSMKRSCENLRGFLGREV